MRVLLTGGAGFIGSHLCDALIAQGDSPVILDNLSTGQLSNIAQFTLLFGDIGKHLVHNIVKVTTGNTLQRGGIPTWI